MSVILEFAKCIYNLASFKKRRESSELELNREALTFRAQILDQAVFATKEDWEDLANLLDILNAETEDGTRYAQISQEEVTDLLDYLGKSAVCMKSMLRMLKEKGITADSLRSEARELGR